MIQKWSYLVSWEIPEQVLPGWQITAPLLWLINFFYSETERMSTENETLLSGLSCVWVFGMWLAMCFCWHARSKKKKRTKIEKEASGKNGVMDVRGRMEEGMKGWMTLMSRPFFGFFNLYPCGIPALPNFLLASLVPALTWTFCLWKVSRGCSASLHSHLTNHSLQLPLILILSPSLLSPPVLMVVN